MSTPLHFQSVAEIAPQIESGALSPIELTDYMLERIADHDGRLRAYVRVLERSARADAEKAAKEISAGRYRGPLHGVPVAVKDLCDIEGLPTLAGCAVREGHVAQATSTVVERLAAAGAVMLGKLNLTEGAMAGYNPKFAVPENPWKESHWSGASSSGSGAATAAGLAFATLGSDTGGSIRHPAAACGTVGLKPTWGAVSRYGVADLAQSLDHVGPLTRASQDAAFVHQAIAGRDEHDPTSAPTTHAAIQWSPEPGRPLCGLRVGWDEAYASVDLAPDFAAAMADAARDLQRLGATLVDVKMPTRLREYMAAWQVLCSSEAAHAHQANYPSRAEEYGPWFREWLRRGVAYTSRDYADANMLRLECVGDIAAVMSACDVLACPSTPREAYPVMPEISYGPIPATRDPWDSRFTVPTDYAGLPTLALPCGLSNNGLPLSFQLVGHRFTELSLCEIGNIFERATSWRMLHPPGW